MDYEKFKRTVKAYLEKDFPDAKHISIESIQKNNGLYLDGIVIMEKDYNISPTLYLNHYFHQYLSGSTFQEVYNDLLQTYLENRPKASVDIRFFVDYKMAKEYIAYKLINYEKNKELLKEIPYIPFLDLAIVFYTVLPDSDVKNATILITNAHMEMWGSSEQELYETASRNMQRLLPVRLTSMKEIMCSAGEYLEGGLPEWLISLLDDCPMHVISNEETMFGATAILYGDGLKRLADQVEDDLVIIPSSIHECILLPKHAEFTYVDELNSLIDEVNETQLRPEEVLADHFYEYSRTSGKITMNENLQE